MIWKELNINEYLEARILKIGLFMILVYPKTDKMNRSIVF
jgi:hypothetical protein